MPQRYPDAISDREMTADLFRQIRQLRGGAAKPATERVDDLEQRLEAVTQQLRDTLRAVSEITADLKHRRAEQIRRELLIARSNQRYAHYDPYHR